MKTTLLHEVNEPDGAEKTFSKVIELINSAKSIIIIHMYVWRSDNIGNAIGDALCDAADRGIKIEIKKEWSAMMYEWIEMNQKSYLPSKPSKLTKLWWKIIRPTFPKTFVKDDYISGAGSKLLEKKNVSIEWIKKVKTHQKYYLFDNKHLITGSINIEDRHRKYFDYMVHIESKELSNRFKSRLKGDVEYVKDQDIEFIFNQPMNDENRFEIKPLIIELIDQAKNDIYIEAAYIGDHDIDEAIIKAANRKVEVSILISEQANIGNDNNYRRAEKIMNESSAKIYLSKKMIHSKMLVFDRKIVMSGSANLSIFSMNNAGELNLLIRNSKLVDDFLKVADWRKSVSMKVDKLKTLKSYNKIIAFLQELHQKLKL